MRALTLSLLLVALVAGCSGDASTSATGGTSEAITMDDLCPISGEAIDEGVTAEYQGKTIRFCCEDCLASWEGMTDEEKQAKLAAAEAKLSK